MATAYPAASDLQSFLYAAGMITANPPTDAQESVLSFGQKASAGSAIWERETDFRPFLAGAASTRVFDPPSMPPHHQVYAGYRGGLRNLDLIGTGIVTLNSLSVGGVPYNQGTQFWPRPSNAAALGIPITWIEFSFPIWGQPESVSINGVFGWGTTIPEDAWLGIVKLAAGECTELPGLVSKGLISWTMENETEQYGEKKVEALVQTWHEEGIRALRRYKRSVF